MENETKQPRRKSVIETSLDDAERLCDRGLFEQAAEILSGRVFNGQTLQPAENERGRAVLSKAIEGAKALRRPQQDVRKRVEKVLTKPEPGQNGFVQKPVDAVTDAPKKTVKKKKKNKKKKVRLRQTTDQEPLPPKKVKPKEHQRFIIRQREGGAPADKYEKKGLTLEGFMRSMANDPDFYAVRANIRHPKPKFYD